MFVTNEFRWLTITDKYMNEFDNWSRPYEYAWILDKVKTVGISNPSIHNTCCGNQPIHLQFAKKLDEISNNVLHTDGVFSNLFASNVKFKVHNIVESYDNSFDIVICISTLEEICAEKRGVVFDNLINQTKSGGRLLLTCDYPHVDLNFFNEKLSRVITETKEIKLNSFTSIAKSNDYKDLNIIVIDITKI